MEVRAGSRRCHPNDGEHSLMQLLIVRILRAVLTGAMHG
jgi:hypothetical protein